MPSHRMAKSACRSGLASQGRSRATARTVVMMAAKVTWKTAGMMAGRPRTLRRE